MIFDTHHWRPDGDGQIERLALESVRHRQRAAVKEGDDDKRKKKVNWAMRSQSQASRRALLDTARILLPIADAGDKWNTDLALLGVSNGVVDLRTGQLRDGRPEDRITRISPVEYDPSTPWPRWERFLTEIFEMLDEENLLDMIDWLQRAVGYSLTGYTTEQCMFIMYGGGANGKSTFLERIAKIAGDYFQKADVQTLMTGREGAVRNDIAKLAGSRLVAAVEPSDTHRIAENVVKEMTGGDTMTARFLHKEFFEFVPEFKIWLGTNHKPEIKGTDAGIWRRIRLIPFETSFVGRQDESLSATLDAELPGVLNWAIAGAQRWFEDGLLGTPNTVQQATAEYRSESDLVYQFLTACTIKKKTDTCKGSELYDEYKRWAITNGFEPVNNTRFGRDLTAKGYSKHRQESGVIYRGLGLLYSRNHV
jgi:putative DNA primase/helicase